MLNNFWCHHLTHIGTTGWISNHRGTAANQSDRLVASHLETFHKTQSHKVSDVQAVSSRIKTNLKDSFTVVDQIFNFLFIGYLGDKAAGS